MIDSLKVIGVDESGKGDFFGPLVIAAFLSENSEIKNLQAMGVRDGKKIANKKLIDINYQLREKYYYSVITIMPDEYNRRYADIKNLNKLLADGHAEAISELAEKYPADLAVSDKFGKSELIENALEFRNCDIKLEQMHGGEAVTQVAAASIIARAEYLLKMDELSDQTGFELPRGAASHVDQAGRELINQTDIKILKKVSKTHFKNYQRIIKPSLF